MRTSPLTSEDHLKRLERRVRRLQQSLVLLLVVWALTSAAGLRAAATPRALEAQSFWVLDQSGQLRAALRAGSDGAELVFFDRNGNSSMVISDRAQPIPIHGDNAVAQPQH